MKFNTSIYDNQMADSNSEDEENEESEIEGISTGMVSLVTNMSY